MSCASMLVLGGTFAGGAAAHPSSPGCTSITHPTTINHDKKCVTVKKTIYGDVVNNAKVGKSQYGDEKPGFFIGDGGLLKGKLVNNGGIYGGERGEGALTLGDGADVRGGIFNNGKIVSEDGSGISLGFYEDGWHGGPQEAALTGNIVNRGYIGGDDYGIAARYGTMSGTLINESGGVIDGDKVGVYVSDTFTSWSGGIENSGLISGDRSGIQIGDFGSYGGEGGEHGGGYNAFSIHTDDGVVFSGGIENKTGGAIISKSGPSIAVGGASFSGGITNDGLITQYPGYGGEGHDYDYSSFGGEGYDSPYKGVGIVFTADTVEGGLFNGVHGEIYGTKGPAVWITDKTESFSGGIANFGLIKGANDGIRIESDAFSGGLINAGAIIATKGDGVSATWAWSGDVSNYGLILGAHDGFAYDGSTFDGDVHNAGLILGGHAGVAMSGDVFDGAFTNSGLIGGGKTGVSLDFDSVTGGFTNSGKIVGFYGDGVSITAGTWGAADARADIVNSGIIIGGETGFALNAGTVYGDFINDGAITGYGENTGVHIVADAFFGDIVNNESIASPYDALVADIDYFDGSFANTGDIAGGANGAVFVLGEMTGDFTNGGSISGAWGNGVDITVGTWGSSDAPVAIANTSAGVISGSATGFALSAGTLHGSFTNDGLIQGGTTGASFAADTFDAPFVNSGDITGGVDGVVMVLGAASGGFTNSGSISGEWGDGVSISVDTWGSADARADILNAATGSITGGETGFALNAGTVYGDFINDGLISGEGENTGAHIVAGTFNGNLVNNETITSPYDALVADIDNFNGSFANAGDITGGANGAVFILGEMTGDFTNSGTISGEYGNGVDIAVDTWGSTEARVAVTNVAGGVISGGATGFALNADTLHGSVTNDGAIAGGVTGASFVVDTFDAPFANSGSISGGVDGVVMALGTASGGFSNSGSIAGAMGDGVDIVVTAWGSAEARADIVNTADGTITGGANGFSLELVTMHGDIDNAGAISGGNIAMLVAGGAFDGAFTNTGDIDGGATGVALTLETVTGAFTNSGSIDGVSGDGVAIAVGTWGAAEARADIVNTATGAITGGDTGFALNAGTVYGDFINDGVISGEGENTGVHIVAETFNGDIVNNESITSPYDALVAEIDTFNGSFANTDSIAGGVNGAVLALGEMTGDFTNSGSISGEYGNGVDIAVQTWGSSEAPVTIANTADGVISGGATGFVLNAGAVHGAFTNDGTIDGGTTGASFAVETFDAPFANSGAISGGVDGVVMALGTASGGFTNSGAIAGATGDGVDIVVTAWGSAEARADIVNAADGTITGGANGFSLELVTMYGNIDNHGAIGGGDIAVLVAGGTFDGAFTNTGDIGGGATGVALTLDTVTGAFTNSGSIDGVSGDGVAIDVGTWGAADARADIVNTASGVIAGGDTGFLLDAGTVYGDFINDGQISGSGENTGVHIIAGTFVGDVVNNESISSPYDALVADIDNFDGSFSNTDSISGGVNGAVFLLGEMTGNATNSGTISGATGNGLDITVETWGSTEAPVAISNTADGVISGGATGFVLNAGAVHGAFTNDGTIDGGTTGASFAVETFDAPFANSGAISGGVDGVVMALGTASGGFTNSGAIAGATGAGVDIVVAAWGSAEARADIVNTADGTITGGANGLSLELVTMHGDVDNHGAIGGGDIAVLVAGGTFDGAFTNTGDIDGGATGVALTLETVTGAFTNSGSIDGVSGDGVAIDVGTWGAADARADIVNTATGVIAGGDTGFSIEAGAVYGDFVNDGLISGGGEETGVHIVAETFVGDVENNNSIDATFDALVVEAGVLDGSFANTGSITGGDSGAVFELGTMTGDFNNSNAIIGDTGDGVAITVDTWGSAIAPVQITNTVDGEISGWAIGFGLNAGAVHGAFANDGSIGGGTTGASFAVETFDAPFANSGSVTGGVDGVVMALGQASGGFSNSGSIGGGSGNGVDIVVAAWGSTAARADIVNTASGVIDGGANGFALELVTMHGDIDNDGAVGGGNIAVLVSGGTFDGAFTNTGDIEGGVTGVAFDLASVSGAFTNSGSIDGASGNGVAITAGTWGAAEARADIVNTATGVITGGETGFSIDAGAVYGDFVNNGQITGGGDNTGVHIVAGTFAGDVVNNEEISAASNALHLEIGDLDGEIVNTGNVTATALNGVAVALEIGNGATFTNSGGGLIIGDVVFGGDAAYHFVAEDGGVEGDLIGEGGEANDDTITVQNGAHYFVDGVASNFASFVVEGGATAFMGARFEGDSAGGGYGFSNVDNLNVNNGGTLYIDRSTTLLVDENFTQQAGGTVEFYLGAPGGAGFTDLTGNVVAGDGDYGQIIVSGTATLDGSVVGFLDPAFADANPNLVEVLYDDVIVADGGISGDFQTVALIADSSLFELSEIIDGNAVDMRVTRTSIDIGDLPGIIVNTGGPFDAMVSDRSNGLGSGSCGLASASDGWCFNRFAANEPGATQVMTDAPPADPFAWLRTGVRKEGETAVWGRAIGAFGETDGYAGSLGTEFTLGGAIAGIDHNFSPTFMAGVAAQWTATDVDFKGRPDNADVESFEAGAYMSYGDTRLYVNANASVIWHDVNVNRFSPTGQASGEYDGTTYSAFAEVGKTFETPEMRIQPFLALSYSHLDTNGYAETGTGTRLNVSDSTFDSMKSIVGARLAYPIELESGRKVVPEFRLAWAHEFMDDQASFVATIRGQQPVPTVVRGEKFSRDTVIVGAGVTVPLSDSSSLFVDYDGGLNSDITTHTVSAGVRFTW